LAEEYITVIQTELPEFALRLLYQRRPSCPKIDQAKVPSEVLDSFGDALAELFKGSFRAMGIVEIVGEKKLQSAFKGYGLQIRKQLKEGKVAKILFFRLKPSSIPLTLDLVSLAVALLSFQPAEVPAAAKGIYDVLHSITALDRDKGEGDLIDVYEAYLTAKANIRLKASSDFPTADAIKSGLAEWDDARFWNALTAMESRKILEPIKPYKSKIDSSNHWREIW